MNAKVIEQLYKTYYHDLYLYAFSFCQNSHTAEELVAETFYKALLCLPKDIPHAKYWLLRVLKNLAVDHHRKEQRIVHKEPPPPSQVASALEQLIQNERRAALFTHMLALPKDARSAIYLKYFMDFRINEIALVLQKNPGAIKTLLSRARSKLRTLMEDTKNEF